MATKWDDLFGREFYFEITNEERKYLGLNSIEDSWDISQFYSKINLWHKRTSIFWFNDTIKKIIVEEKRVSDERVTYECITEYDTDLHTENLHLHDNAMPQKTKELLMLWESVMKDKNYHIIVAIEDESFLYTLNRSRD